MVLWTYHGVWKTTPLRLLISESFRYISYLDDFDRNLVSKPQVPEREAS